MLRRRPEEPMHDAEEPGYGRGLPDERTRRIARVGDEVEEPAVNVKEPAPYLHERHERSTGTLLVTKAQQTVWYFFGIIETLLALRFILLAVGANPANPFFNFVRGLTNSLVAPFANLVQTPQLGGSTIELSTVFAMIIYLLVAIAIAKLLEILLSRGDSY